MSSGSVLRTYDAARGYAATSLAEIAAASVAARPWFPAGLTCHRNRRAGAQMVVRPLESLGPLQPGLNARRATDLLWIFNDPAHYNALVLQSGWPELAYTEWLSREMRNA